MAFSTEPTNPSGKTSSKVLPGSRRVRVARST